LRFEQPHIQQLKLAGNGLFASLLIPAFLLYLFANTIPLIMVMALLTKSVCTEQHSDLFTIPDIVSFTISDYLTLSLIGRVFTSPQK
jgi:hypothetical protein